MLSGRLQFNSAAGLRTRQRWAPASCRGAGGRVLLRINASGNQQQQDKEKAPPSPPPPSNDPKGSQDQARLDAMLEELKKSGLDAAKAKKLLQAWTKIGVKDPEQLRKMLVNRSIQPLRQTLIQMVIDAIACAGGFYLAYVASQSGDLPFRIVVELVGNFAGLYYFINVLLELSVASGILFSTYRFGTNSKEVLEAVRQLAGPSSGISLVDKATAAVNTFKVLQALDEVARLLKDQYGEAVTTSSRTADSLRNLSALLTLSRAKEELGFKPEQYGLSEKQAGNIALAFSVYDLNDNGKLEAGEIGNLCASLGWTLNEAEVKEAIKTLDRDKNGAIDFTEFVEWWCKQRPTTP